MNEEFYNYIPTQEEMRQINQKIKTNKIIVYSVSACILVIACFPLALALKEKSIILFLVDFGLLSSIVSLTKSLPCSIKNMNFSCGEIIDYWKESSKNNDGSESFLYYATIRQPNGVINKQVLITKEIYESKESRVFMLYDKRNVIKEVFLKNDGFLYEREF